MNDKKDSSFPSASAKRKEEEMTTSWPGSEKGKEPSTEAHYQQGGGVTLKTRKKRDIKAELDEPSNKMQASRF